MKGEQLEIMKVIDFPKNRHIENIERNNKLQVAIKLLEYLVSEGAEYHIILSKEDTLKLFDDNGKIREYLIMTSNFEKGAKIKIDHNNSNVFLIESGSLD